MIQNVLFVLAVLMPSAAVGADAIVAQVNGTEIRTTDLEIAVKRKIPQYSFHQNVSEERLAEIQIEALEELITTELQFQDAVKRGMKPEKSKVNEGMKKIRERFASKDEYKQALKTSGMTEEKLRAQVEKGVLVEQVKRAVVTEPARISDEAVEKHYRENTAMFKRPESVRLRIITMSNEQRAMETLARVKTGEDFGALAASMSEDQYRVKGGDIGFIHRGRILPELEEQAFRIEIGKTSDIISADNKWFIIKVEDRKKEEQLSFDAMKSKIKQDLEQARAKELSKRWMSDLRSAAKIEVLLRSQAASTN